MSFHLAVFCSVAKRRTAVLGLCRAYFHLRKRPCRVVSFTSFETILAEPFFYDAYLLPITPPPEGQRLPDGILAAQQLRANGMLNPIIFVASTPEWAYEAYRVDALQYLPMPLSSANLYPALERALAPLQSPIFALTTAEGIYGIPFQEIESVECTNHILHFHRREGGSIRSITLRVPLRTAIAPLLNEPNFLQPHRSYVVNLAAVACLRNGEFEMNSGMCIPVPRERFAAIKAAYTAFLENTHTPTTPTTHESDIDFPVFG